MICEEIYELYLSLPTCEGAYAVFLLLFPPS